MSETKQLIDPISGYVYSCTDDGLVEVRDPDTGQWGTFDDSGQHHAGELTYANRQLLGWVGRLSARRGATPPPRS